MEFPTFLVLIFITLKLVGAIAWSWWWVFSPWWIGLLAFLFYGGIFLLVKTSRNDGYGRRAKKQSRNEWKKML